MNDLYTYLRCETGHANQVHIRERDAKAGTPCSVCAKPLLANPGRMEGPRGRRF